MHRDTKLGLALGILLIGTVGAFFFRNEQTPRHDPPGLVNPRALDEQIAEKPVTPYLMAPEFGEGNKSSIETDPISSLRSSDPWEVPDFLKDDAGDIPVGRRTALPGPPDPILTSRQSSDPIVVKLNDITAVPEIPTPDHNKAWETTTSRSVATPPTASAPSGDLIDYRVQPGDTLSGLAARHLGSSARFMSLYEMNRDVLRSPDDLRVGMTIRLPNPNRPASALPVSVPADTISRSTAVPTPPAPDPTSPTNSATRTEVATPAAPAPTSPAPDDNRPRLFKPARRSPLSPGGVPTSQTEVLPKAVKDLLQTASELLPKERARQ